MPITCHLSRSIRKSASGHFLVYKLAAYEMPENERFFQEPRAQRVNHEKAEFLKNPIFGLFLANL